MKLKCFFWIVNRVLIAGVLYAVFLTGLNLYLSRAIDAQVESLNEMGVAATVSEFSIPCKEGADAGPLLRAAAELLKSSAPAEGNDDRRPFNYVLKDGGICEEDTNSPATDAELETIRVFVKENERVLTLLLEASDHPGYKPVTLVT